MVSWKLVSHIQEQGYFIPQLFLSSCLNKAQNCLKSSTAVRDELTKWNAWFVTAFSSKVGLYLLKLEVFWRKYKEVEVSGRSKAFNYRFHKWPISHRGCKHMCICVMYTYIALYTGDLETCLSVALKPVPLLSYSWFYGITYAIFKILPLRVIWSNSLRFWESPMSL